MKVFVFGNDIYGLNLLRALLFFDVNIVGMSSRMDNPNLRTKGKELLGQIAYDFKLKMPKSHIKAMPNVFQEIVKTTYSHNIPLFDSALLRDPSFLKNLENIKPDLILCFGFHTLIPQEVLKIPLRGAINIHPGTLPERAGGTPVRWSVFYADAELAITAHAMTNRFDSGKIVQETRMTGMKGKTTQQIEEKILSILPEFVCCLMETVKNNGNIYNESSDLKPQILAPFKGTYQKINWSTHDALTIERICKAMKPKSGATALLKNKEICFWEIEPQENIITKEAPGVVIDFDSAGYPILAAFESSFKVNKILYGHSIKSGKTIRWFYEINKGDRLL